MCLKLKSIAQIDFGRKVRKWLQNGLNIRGRTHQSDSVRKSVKIPELLSSCSVRETFDPEIQKIPEFQ